jgi:hypothetical protein
MKYLAVILAIAAFVSKGFAMDQISPEYFTHHNLVTVKPNMSNHTENSILYLAEYCLLYKQKFGKLPFSRTEIQDTIEYFRIGDKHFVAHPDNFDETKENPWSHDNHTGMVTLSYLYNLPYHKTLGYEYWKYRIQPWNLAYYAILSNKYLGFLLKPIIALKHITGVINFTENDKTETGGKIIGYIQLSVLNMDWTKRLCEWILKKNTMFKSYQAVFDYYFKDEKHPNREIWRVK